MYVKSLTLRDIRRVAPFLRSIDATEARVLGGLEPFDALVQSWKISTSSWAIYLGHTPVGMFGSVPLPDGGAVAWMVGTPAMTVNPSRFAAASLPFVSRLLQRYEYLTNVLFQSNTVHIRWLEWLGFDIEPAGYSRRGDALVRCKGVYATCHRRCRPLDRLAVRERHRSGSAGSTGQLVQPTPVREYFDCRPPIVHLPSRGLAAEVRGGDSSAGSNWYDGCSECRSSERHREGFRRCPRCFRYDRLGTR